MPTLIKTALIQMQIAPSPEENIQHAFQQIKKAAHAGAKLIVLPEVFIIPYDVHQFTKVAVSEDDSMWLDFKKISLELQIVIIAGTVIEKDQNKLYNTSFVFDNGQFIGKHRKAHLFDIDIPGKIVFKESEHLTAGEQITVLSTSLGKIGVAICFDMRFPELFKKMALAGAQIMIVPAAFNLVTGPLHWELLIRARAIDTQSFMLVCSPPLQTNYPYKAYGHSMVVDPRGKILATLSDSPEILYTNIDLSVVEEARQQLPVLSSTHFL